MSIYTEAALLKRILEANITCALCSKLGWDKDCEDKNKCGETIYRKLAEHYKEADK